MRCVRLVVVCTAFLMLAATLLEARGAGGGGFGGGGGGRGGKGKGKRASAQELTIVNNVVRRDNVRRSRFLDW